MRLSSSASLSLAIIFLFGLMSPAVTAQEQRDQSTPEERAEVVRFTEYLEQNPFAEEADKLRKLIFAWLVDVPDIEVSPCQEFLDPLMKAKRKYGSELMMQLMFASAVFVIENPDQANDESAQNLAGIQSVLATYTNILAVKPKAHIKYLDKLLKLQEAGELSEYVKKETAKCHG